MGREGVGAAGGEGRGGRVRKSDEQHKKVQKRRKEESSVFSFSFPLSAQFITSASAGESDKVSLVIRSSG